MQLKCCSQTLQQTMVTAVALTVQDAVKMRASQLRLVHRRLSAVPDLTALSSLTSLDLSDNPIQAVSTQCLPTGLKELVLAGCHLSGTLPHSLTQVSSLEQLVLSANQITEADAVFACPHLVHACLAYNHLRRLVSSERSSSSMSYPKRSISAASSSSTGAAHSSVLASSPIMCLDLSHNSISELEATLQQLQQLPKLRALHLRGNPVTLLPQYKATVLQHLPHLAYLDGQKLDDAGKLPAAAAVGAAAGTSACAEAASSRAQNSDHISTASADSTAAAGTVPVAATQVCSAIPATVMISLELEKLQVSQPSAGICAALAAEGVAQLQQLMLQQGLCSSRPATAAETTGTALSALPVALAPCVGSTSITGSTSSGTTTDTSLSGSCGDAAALQASVPLLPVRYHMEVCGPDGCGYCSAALLVQPPPPPADETARGAAAAAAPGQAAAADSKKASLAKGAKPAHQDTGKAATASKARPGSSVRPSVTKGVAAGSEVQQAAVTAAESTMPCLQPGCLHVKLCAPADVATRDWLKSGFDIKLVCTRYQPRPMLPSQDLLHSSMQSGPSDTSAPPAQLQPSVAALSTAPTATKAGAAPAAAKPVSKQTTSNTVSSSGSVQQAPASSWSSSGGATAGPGLLLPEISWQQEFKQEDVGTAHVCTPALVEGCVSATRPLEASGHALFLPPAPLLHPVTHIRLALYEAQQQQLQPVGSCGYKVTLQG